MKNPFLLRVLAASLYATLSAHAETTLPAGSGPSATVPSVGQIFNVEQSVTVNDIPAGARNVRLWVSIPDEGFAQRVLDLSVTAAPGPWQIVRDRTRGDRFLYVEVVKPRVRELTTTIAFSVQRAAVQFDLNPAIGTAIPKAQRALFAEELRADAPHMGL